MIFLCLKYKSLLFHHVFRLQRPLSMCTWMYLPVKLGCLGFFKKGGISQLLLCENNGFILRHDWIYSKAENLTVEELSGFSHLLVEGSHRYTLQLR